MIITIGSELQTQDVHPLPPWPASQPWTTAADIVMHHIDAKSFQSSLDEVYSIQTLNVHGHTKGGLQDRISSPGNDQHFHNFQQHFEQRSNCSRLET